MSVPQMTERQFRQKVEPMLEPYFHLHREVHGHDEFFDERRVIDLVIEPKCRYLSVELKRPQRMDSSAIGHWIRQAFNYQRTDWGRFGAWMPCSCRPPLGRWSI